MQKLSSEISVRSLQNAFGTLVCYGMAEKNPLHAPQLWQPVYKTKSSQYLSKKNCREAYRTNSGRDGHCPQLGGGRPQVTQIAKERGVRHGIRSDGRGNCWFGGGLGTLHGGSNLYTWQSTVNISLKKKDYQMTY